MKHKLIFIFATMLLMASCISCGSPTPHVSSPQELPIQTDILRPTEPAQESPADPGSYDSQDANPANGDELFALSNLSGTVTEFSDTGCTVTPTVYEDEVAVEAAPRFEDQQTLVSVIYNENCTFQFAYANMQTGEISCEAANVSDIKKQTRLVVCGEYDSNDALHASRVFIYRMGE